LSDYPIQKAWDRVAKMLFPDEPARACTKRDAWLIDRYYLQIDMGVGRSRGLFDRRPKTLAPRELTAEVDTAYFRLSLMERVDQWFEKRGFDLQQPTIPRQDFEAALANQKPSAASRAKPTSDADLATFKRDYLAKGGRPFASPFEMAARTAGINATRERLRAAFPARQRGRPNKSPK
jgi:hypothetical protein